MPSTLSYTIENCFTDSEWHNWRRTGIGASEAAVITGEITKPSRMDIWLKKLGKGSPSVPTEPMRWGKRLEDDIAEEYTEQTGLALKGQQTHVRSAERLWQIASLDAIAEDDRVVEFKTAGLWTAKKLVENEIESLPRSWILQVQHQLSITGAASADIAVFTPELRLLIFRLPRHEGLIEAICDIEAEFWNYVQHKTPPPSCVIGDAESLLCFTGITETTVDLDQEAQEAADLYAHCSEQIKLFEETKAIAKEELLRAMGSSGRGRLPNGGLVSLSMISVKERTKTVKAYSYPRLSISDPKEG